jgi:hypothetical protein
MIKVTIHFLDGKFPDCTALYTEQEFNNSGYGVTEIMLDERFKSFTTNTNNQRVTYERIHNEVKPESRLKIEQLDIPKGPLLRVFSCYNNVSNEVDAKTLELIAAWIREKPDVNIVDIGIHKTMSAPNQASEYYVYYEY